MSRLLFIYLLCILSNSLMAQNGDGFAASQQNDPKMQWWKDAKFGMFIHWGPYSVFGGIYNGHLQRHGGAEWIMNRCKIPVAEYQKIAATFNPEKFDAESIVILAKEVGMKYIVITAKHHDGFAMFKSNASKFNIVDFTSYKKDIIDALAQACRKHNMKLGFYYSQAQDWNNPGGSAARKVMSEGWANPDSARIDAFTAANDGHWDSAQLTATMDEYIDKIAVPQVNELLSNYGEVAVLWWDTPTNMTKIMAQKLNELTKPYSNLITNNRLGAGLGGDLETPEQFVPATGFPGRNWEVCMTMNGSWGYNAYDDRWKSTGDLLPKLIDIVSKGGNFLLNVGPNQYGIIPEVCQQNLREMGDWLKVNGEAIYGTQASPFPYLSWGRATQKGQKLYLHVFDWPTDGKLVVPFSNKITKAWLLADAKTRLKVTSGKENSTIQLPSYAPDKIASVVVVEFVGKPAVQPVPSQGAKVNASSTVEGSQTAFATDGDPKNKWQAAKSEKSGMLEIDLGKPATIQCLSVVEPWHPWSRIRQKHELFYLSGSEWKSVLTAETDGTGLTKNFAPITAKKFKLVIWNEKEAPAVNELMLFRDE